MKVSEHLLIMDIKRIKTKNGFKTILSRKGKVRATIPDTQKQPHGNCKTIVLNDWKWKLNWIKDD
jgi:hypothetical protein